MRRLRSKLKSINDRALFCGANLNRHSLSYMTAQEDFSRSRAHLNEINRLACDFFARCSSEARYHWDSEGERQLELGFCTRNEKKLSYIVKINNALIYDTFRRTQARNIQKINLKANYIEKRFLKDATASFVPCLTVCFVSRWYGELFTLYLLLWHLSTFGTWWVLWNFIKIHFQPTMQIAFFPLRDVVFNDDWVIPLAVSRLDPATRILLWEQTACWCSGLKKSSRFAVQLKNFSILIHD